MNASIPAIELLGLAKRYPGFNLGPINLVVPSGAIYGLIGPNGAGKTTALDLIFGLGQNEGGSIRVLGFDHRADEVELKQRAAYVGPDMSYAVWGSVGKAIRFVRGFYPGWDDAYCAHLLHVLELSPNAKIAHLSFGARTKLALLLALARRPQVLVLDEPTTGLDPVSKQQVFGELLRAVEGGERSVLVSSHNLGDIERFADHVALLKSGRLMLEGRTDEIVERFRLVDFFCPERFRAPAGLLVLRREGERYRALLDQRSEAPEWLRAREVRDLSSTRLTLEDLFVALVKESSATPTVSP